MRDDKWKFNIFSYFNHTLVYKIIVSTIISKTQWLIKQKCLIWDLAVIMIRTVYIVWWFKRVIPQVIICQLLMLHFPHTLISLLFVSSHLFSCCCMFRIHLIFKNITHLRSITQLYNMEHLMSTQGFICVSCTGRL